MNPLFNYDRNDSGDGATPVPCTICQTNGRCQTCKGTGHSGFFLREAVGSMRPCWRCGGTGACSVCAGKAVAANSLFEPYIYVTASKSMPTSVTVAAFTGATWRYITIPSLILQRTFEAQRGWVLWRVRKHYRESGGKCPLFGDIETYEWIPARGVRIRLYGGPREPGDFLNRKSFRNSTSYAVSVALIIDCRDEGMSMRFTVRNRNADSKLSPKMVFSRGKIPLFLDENLLALKLPLEKKGFTVLAPRPGKADADILAEDLPGRIFVTDKPRDFMYSAAFLDFSIIDVTQVSKEPKLLADMIAHAWLDYSLKAAHPAFYLLLRQNGQHEIATDL